MPTPYQAVIFDLDGTLLDTLDDLADAANQTLAHFGQPTHSIDAYRLFVGDGLLTLIDRIIPDGRRGPEDLARYAAKFQELYMANWDATSRPYPGIEEMVAQLAASPLRLCVLSNKPQAFTQLCVQRFFGSDCFELVFGERPGVAKKPDPAGALEIADTLGLEPAVILYVGDTATDMKTGQGAGMDTVGVLWGFRDRAELEEHRAGLIVATPKEIVDHALAS